MVMCHMIADTVAELHEMAGRIGLKSDWFQPGSRPHYDLSKERRRAAVGLGAVEVGRRELVLIMRRQAPVWAAEFTDARSRGLAHP